MKYANSMKLFDYNPNKMIWFPLTRGVPEEPVDNSEVDATEMPELDRGLGGTGIFGSPMIDQPPRRFPPYSTGAPMPGWRRSGPTQIETCNVRWTSLPGCEQCVAYAKIRDEPYYKVEKLPVSTDRRDDISCTIDVEDGDARIERRDYRGSLLWSTRIISRPYAPGFEEEPNYSVKWIVHGDVVYASSVRSICALDLADGHILNRANIEHSRNHTIPEQIFDLVVANGFIAVSTWVPHLKILSTITCFSMDLEIKSRTSVDVMLRAGLKNPCVHGMGVW
jgi:hypothetical protein